MSHKHTGEIPTSRIGQRVHFGPPGDVKKRGGGGTSGTILDEVWTLGAKEASWGRYCFFSQLIKWDYDGKRTIRLGYYRRRKGEKHWEFGSQTTVNSAPKIVRALQHSAITVLRGLDPHRQFLPVEVDVSPAQGQEFPAPATQR